MIIDAPKLIVKIEFKSSLWLSDVRESLTSASKISQIFTNLELKLFNLFALIPRQVSFIKMSAN